MNVHTNTVFNSILQDIREAIPYITSSFSYDPVAVQLQMEEINQDIQDITSNYVFNISTNNTTADNTINNIKEFLQDHNSYSVPPTTPISQFSPPTAWEHIIYGIIEEGLTTTAATASASAPNKIIPNTMSTLDPEAPLSDPTEEPSNFLSTHSWDNPKE